VSLLLDFSYEKLIATVAWTVCPLATGIGVARVVKVKAFPVTPAPVAQVGEGVVAGHRDSKVCTAVICSAGRTVILPLNIRPLFETVITRLVDRPVIGAKFGVGSMMVHTGVA
jgi:hypothetical protein